ncbi:hypothetical protein [Chroococcus sp. FPU101]|nr:hypothetical protein [Chroococcus sp. FPU101]
MLFYIRGKIERFILYGFKVDRNWWWRFLNGTRESTVGSVLSKLHG